MNSRLSLILVASFAACAWTCCTPDQWEGEEGALAGYARAFQRGILKEKAFVAYDYTNRRTVAFLNYVNGDYEGRFQIVTRYDSDGKKGRLFFVDLKKDECRTRDLDREFRKACIPKDAKEYGPFFMGLEGGFRVRGFEVHTGPITTFVNVVDLEEGVCVPVGETLTGTLRKVSFMQSLGFINIRPGIKNATIFDVPKQCSEAQETDQMFAAVVERDHFILAV
ncbi:ependymin-related protein 1 [Aplysia californica]|uniref:Ependymin-related protein 1 n=1 Tax=Aplysia californica TaxID=6500 RepID=A0ABM0ZVJ0_APLCA|nr:ependymin-related protein 1 [Aplysia californica]